VSGRHLVITGASGGIGRATALRLASDFGRITFVGRDANRHAPVMDATARVGARSELVECELTSLRSVADAAASIVDPVDVVVANAGVGGRRGITEDGFELHFGVNHLAHHLLITELADRILDRVVVVSSNMHHDATGVDVQQLRRPTASFTGIPEYRNSKLANVLAGRQLARRYPFATHIVHPGLVATGIWRRIPWPLRPLLTRRMASSEVGADTPSWAAIADGLASGGYYSRRTLQPPSALAQDDEAGSRLWETSEEWVAGFRRRAP
jgi:retinol dehydrogenase 12